MDDELTIPIPIPTLGGGAVSYATWTVKSIYSWSKITLCKHLEILLRNKTLFSGSSKDEPNYKYFYGPEETIEYNINSKKFK